MCTFFAANDFRSLDVLLVCQAHQGCTPSPTSCPGCPSPTPGTIRGLGTGAEVGDVESWRDGLHSPRKAAEGGGWEGASAATRQDMDGDVSATAWAEGGGRGAEATCPRFFKPSSFKMACANSVPNSVGEGASYQLYRDAAGQRERHSQCSFSCNGYQVGNPSPRPAPSLRPPPPRGERAVGLRGGGSWFRPWPTGAAPQARTSGRYRADGWSPSLGTPCGPKQSEGWIRGRQEQGSPSPK